MASQSIQVRKHSNLVNDFKRETDQIKKLLDGAQEAEDEVDENLLSNDELENSLIHANEIILNLHAENVKRIQYLKEHSRRLNIHKISISENRNLLKTAKNNLASAGTFIQIAQVADDVESMKTDTTEKLLHTIKKQMAEDEKTRLKLEKVLNMTRDPIEELGKFVNSSVLENELNFTPDINHLQIRDVIPQVTIESLQSKSQLVMELIRQGLIFGVQELEGRKRYAQITLDNKSRICLHYLREHNLPPKAHLLKHSDILKLMDESSRLVFLELSKEEVLGRLYIRLSPQTKRGDQFALLCSGEKGVSYVQSNLHEKCSETDIETDIDRVFGGDYENHGGKGGRALIPGVLKEGGGVLNRPQRAGLIRGRCPFSRESQASQFIILLKDRPEEVQGSCFGMVEEGLSILQEAIARSPDIREVISDAGMVIPI